MQIRELTARQRRFVAAVVMGVSVKASAEEAGISERTARTWMKSPAVRAELSAALGDALGLATRQTVAAMGSAVATLQAIHADDAQPAGARVSAAGRILESGPRLAEMSEITARLDALENAYSELQAERQQPAEG